MTHELLVGTRGWDVDAWQGGFYPDELPAEWRFSFYSNLYRSVLVPGDVWETTTPDQVAEWLEDSDSEFRFVCELPPALSHPDADAAAFERFFELSAPLATRTAAWLLRPTAVAAPDPVWLGAWLGELENAFPVCVDLPPGPWRGEPLRAAIQAAGASLCWRPELEAEPSAYGDFLVALAEDAPLTVLRTMVETLGRWMDGTRGAGCFFDAAEQSPKLAQETRILAELLEI